MHFNTLDANLILGKKYNRLTIVKYYPSKTINGKQSIAKVLCVCECGNKALSSIQNVRNGHTKSCGCYHKDVITKHLLSQHPSYAAWSAMKRRCYDVKIKDYPRYGGRGITVCNRWLNSVESFIEDMGIRPSKEYSLDRINNDGNYEPSNCRWATNKEQANNKENYRKDKRVILTCNFCKKKYSAKKSVEFRSKFCSKRCRYNKL